MHKAYPRRKCKRRGRLAPIGHARSGLERANATSGTCVDRLASAEWRRRGTGTRRSRPTATASPRSRRCARRGRDCRAPGGRSAARGPRSGARIRRRPARHRLLPRRRQDQVRALFRRRQWQTYERACESRQGRKRVRQATHCIARRRSALPRPYDAECPYGISVQHGKGDRFDGRAWPAFAPPFPTMHAPPRNRSTPRNARSRMSSAAFPTTTGCSTRPLRIAPLLWHTPSRCALQAPRSRRHRRGRRALAPLLPLRQGARARSVVVQNRGKTVVMIRFNPDACHPRTTCTCPRNRFSAASPSWRRHPRRPTLTPASEDPPSSYASSSTTRQCHPKDERVAAGLAGHKAIGKRTRALAGHKAVGKRPCASADSRE